MPFEKTDMIDDVYIDICIDENSCLWGVSLKHRLAHVSIFLLVWLPLPTPRIHLCPVEPCWTQHGLGTNSTGLLEMQKFRPHFKPMWSESASVVICVLVRVWKALLSRVPWWPWDSCALWSAGTAHSLPSSNCGEYYVLTLRKEVFLLASYLV